MSDIVFVSGDFSSGTTVLFSLFRATGDFYCLYEPLHEKLPEYLVYPLRPDEEHHVNVEPYFSEFKPLRRTAALFRPQWASKRLFLDADDDAPDLERYLRYLVDEGIRRRGRVMLKENRIGFRLGWLKSTFPSAKVVHVYRAKDDQWASIVRRGQEALGREDIGQHDVGFAGFSVASICDDLETVYPELAPARSASGYERFSKLWDLSFANQQRHADVSIGLHELIADFDGTVRLIGDRIGYGFDLDRLRPLVIPNRASRRDGERRRNRSIEIVDLWGRKYAKARVAARYALRGRHAAARDVIAGTPGRTPF